MSAVTLETLRADFDAARAKWLSAPIYRECRTAFSDWDADEAARVLGEGVDLHHERNGAMPMAACIYVIARDHGLEAAVLYKLSDGAIDPRKEVRS